MKKGIEEMSNVCFLNSVECLELQRFWSPVTDISIQNNNGITVVLSCFRGHVTGITNVYLLQRFSLSKLNHEWEIGHSFLFIQRGGIIEYQPIVGVCRLIASFTRLHLNFTPIDYVELIVLYHKFYIKSRKIA